MANGFLSFEDYLGANEGTEEDLLRQAVEAAEAKDRDSIQSLRQVEREGAAAGQTDITQVASYGDYLAAKRGSQDAWAKLMQSADPRQRAVLTTLGARMGIGDKAAASGDRMNAREATASGDLKSLADSRSQWAALNQKRQDADASRRADDATRARDFYEGVYAKGPAGDQGFLTGQRGASDRSQWAQMVARGLGSKAFELPGADPSRQRDLQGVREENVFSAAWGDRNRNLADEEE